MEILEKSGIFFIGTAPMPPKGGLRRDDRTCQRQAGSDLPIHLANRFLFPLQWVRGQFSFGQSLNSDLPSASYSFANILLLTVIRVFNR